MFSSRVSIANLNQRDASGQTALCKSALRGDVEEVERLLAAGCDANVKSVYEEDTPLHVAANFNVVRLLVEHGADIEASNKLGYLYYVILLFATKINFEQRNADFFS
jgi:ankyrin repeat protein